MYKYRRRHNWKDILILFAVLLLITVFIAAVIFAVAYAGGKLTKVITYNVGFWIVLFISFVFGLYRKLTNPNSFSWFELPIQLLVSFVVITALYALFFATSANITDTEIWNGYVQRAEYYEEWKEEVTYTVEVEDGKDSDGNTQYRTETRTRIDHHPPQWQVKTSVGDFKTNKNVYDKYVRRFNNQKKVAMHRMNQVSHGDGNMYFVSHGGQINDTLVPASIENRYVNYLKASDSIRKISGSISGYQNLLKPYPRVHTGQFGPIAIDRVINAGVELPAQWSDQVDQYLDKQLSSLGPRRQVNIIVYCVNTADQGFAYALEEYWVKGKKNDVVVILGITEFPSVDFCYVMAWTKNEEFVISLRNSILNLSSISDGNELAKLIVDEISSPTGHGGFIRMPMASLEYLIADIKLPIWCQVIIIVIGGLVSWIISVFLIRNEIL